MSIIPAKRIANLRPTAVNHISQQMRALQAQGRDIVSLMRGEPDLPTPVHIVEACEKAMRSGRTGYPDNFGEKGFREAIAVKLKRDNGLDYDPATEILATSGATLGIEAALAALINEGDEVLLPDPVYDAYHSPIRLYGGKIKMVPSPIVNGRFVLTAEALEEAWTPATKVLILNTPWNPVGTVMTRAELSAISDFCVARNVVLLSDEIYETIVYDGAKHVSPLAVNPELRDRSVLINSLSKTYAMPGWRVGYCAGPVEILRAMFLVLAQSSRGPATFIQDAAAVALSGPQDCTATMQVEYAKRRAQVSAAMAGVPKVKILEPEGGFFSMADVREIGLPSDEIRLRLLNDHGVCVAHGAAYGPTGEGTLRVSFASGGAALAKGLERLRAGLIAIGNS
ncbi:MAG: pyridoxal phosphate-dependent aminotransferase [Bryobacteraceae bacterium]